MEIGSRSGSRPRIVEYSRDSANADALGVGIGRAIQGLGQELVNTEITTMEVRKLTEDRLRQQKRATTDVEFLRWQNGQNRNVVSQTSNMQPGAAGLTNGIDKGMGESFEDFKKRTGLSADPELLLEYEERFEQFRGATATAVFKMELEEGDRFLGEQITSLVDESRELIRTDPGAFETEFGNVSKIIDDSMLPPVKKEAIKKAAFETMAGTVFQKEVEQAAAGELPAGDWRDGTMPVAPGLSAGAVAFLNATSARESGGDYSIRYNGDGGGDGTPRHFESFADHPRIYSRRSDGRLSSAAGRYQFVASTWDEVVGLMAADGIIIPDFSPQSQDKVAWYQAQRLYRGRTGRELSAVMNSGDREAIKGVRSVLASEWEAFSKMSDDAFANLALGANGIQRGGTGSSELPDLWSDPRYADLPFDTKVAMGAAAETSMGEFRKQQAAAATAAEENLANEILLAFRNNDPAAEAAAERSIAEGKIRDIALVNKLDAQMEERREGIAASARIEQKLVQGGVLEQTDSEDLGRYYQQSGGIAALQELAPVAVTSLVSTTTQTGILPENVTTVLQRQLTSPNPREQNFAMAAIASLYEARPGAFRDEKLREDAAAAATLFRYNTDPQKALAQWNLLRGPEGAAVREAFDKQADALLEEKGMRDFFRNATTSWARNMPKWLSGMPATRVPDLPADNLAFQDDYETLFRNYFPVFGGDEALAHEAAGRAMADVWAPNPITGGLMKNSPLAPGMNVVPVDGSYAWIESEVRRQTGLAPDASFTIVSDAQTVLDARERGTASYNVIQIDGEGNYSLRPERFRAVVPKSVMKEKKVEMNLMQTRAKYQAAERAFARGDSVAAGQLKKDADLLLKQALAVSEAGNPAGQIAEVEAALRALDSAEDRIRAEPGAPEGPIAEFETERERLGKVLRELNQ